MPSTTYLKRKEIYLGEILKVLRDPVSGFVLDEYFYCPEISHFIVFGAHRRERRSSFPHNSWDSHMRTYLLVVCTKCAGIQRPCGWLHRGRRYLSVARLDAS